MIGGVTTLRDIHQYTEAESITEPITNKALFNIAVRQFIGFAHYLLGFELKNRGYNKHFLFPL